MKIFTRAFKTSLPALFCYFPLGIIYGILCAQEGYPWYYAPLFSFFVLAGAMQFLALSILGAGGSLLTVAIAIIPLGIRNIFYGMTMLDRYRPAPKFLRFYLAHGLVDATYSLLHMHPPYESAKEDIRYAAFLTAFTHISWVIGSLLGSFVIQFVQMPNGLEFALTAFFAAAATEHFLKKKELKPIVIAICSISVALWLAPHHFFLAAVAVAFLACLALPAKERSVA